MATSTGTSGLFGWWRAGTPEGRRALLAGGLGWMLDSFDVMLYALVLATLMQDLEMSKATAGVLGSITLVASAVGGIVFGIIADRYGRTRALIGCHRLQRPRPTGQIPQHPLPQQRPNVAVRRIRAAEPEMGGNFAKGGGQSFCRLLPDKLEHLALPIGESIHTLSTAHVH